jgi:hypothetical protein
MVAAVRRVRDWWQHWQRERADHPLVRPALLFPEAYTWFVFVSAMDLLLTWVILHYEGGREANALTNAVIQRFDLLGLVAYKFAIVVGVITICEIVGRMRYRAGLRLAWAATRPAAEGGRRAELSVQCRDLIHHGAHGEHGEEGKERSVTRSSGPCSQLCTLQRSLS